MTRARCVDVSNADQPLRRPWPSQQCQTSPVYLAMRWLGLLAAGAVAQVSFSANGYADDLRSWTPAAIKPIELPVLSGGNATLATHSDNVVIVHFFATWCEPCQTELRDLDRLVSDLKGSPLRILAIDAGEPKVRTQRYFEANPVAFPVLLDIDKAVTKAWGVETLPTTFVLAANLCPLWRTEGFIDWTAPATVSKLAAALAELNSPSPLPSHKCPPLGEPK